MKLFKNGKLVNAVSFRLMVAIGTVMLCIIMIIASCINKKTETEHANNAMNTLKQQCNSFDRLVLSNQTNSLFRLTDILGDVKRDIENNSSYLSDEYLENYTDNMRINGIAVLDSNLKLVASGYTRQFSNADWSGLSNGINLSDIAASNNKIFTTRIIFENKYYDVCAISRENNNGVIVGFYEQPTGTVDGTENDLERLLNGFSLDDNGQYIITEDGNVRVSSEESMFNTDVDENVLLNQISHIKNDGKLHFFSADGKWYFGYRSGYDGYMIYIYYPFVKFIISVFVSAFIFITLYLIIVFLYFATKNKALYKSREQLRQSNIKLNENIRMLKALETIYFSLFYIDFADNTFKTIYLAPWLEGAVPYNGSYTDLKKILLGNMVLENSKAELSKIVEYSFVCESLNKESVTDARKSFYRDYQAIRNGEIKWCRVTVTTVDYDNNGNPLHVLALLQDVDDEKRKEEEYQAQILKESNDARIANNAKTEFLRRINHDIRTPINGIKGYIELAAQNANDFEFQNYCLNKISVSVDVLLELVSGILDMSKFESGELVLEERPFDLIKLLDDINTVLSPLAIKNGVNYEDLRGNDLSVTHLIGSPRHLSQVIMNITSNAVKYSKPNGWVKFSTKLLSVTKNSATYEFVCSDNGIGMSKDFQKHMFEPFMQEAISARTKYEGSGLGLAIVKKLVDAMGGTVTCDSKKNRGTTFHITLTFSIDTEYVEKQPTEQNHNKEILNNKNILVVEDNELNMEITELLLKGIGANVTKAWNGKEAVETFKASEIGYFDLIFMDIMMPETDGLEATRQIRALERSDAKTVPISAMSANEFADDVKKSIDAGMNYHISKPVDEEKFISVAEKIFNANPTGEFL